MIIQMYKNQCTSGRRKALLDNISMNIKEENGHFLLPIANIRYYISTTSIIMPSLKIDSIC